MLAPAPCRDDPALVVSSTPEKAYVPGSSWWVSETPFTLQKSLRRDLYW